jgi:hypothetical protein
MTGKTSRTWARVAKKPALLAGGNPQIAKADGDDPVQGYIAAMPELEIPRRTNVSGRCEVRAWRERNAKVISAQTHESRGEGTAGARCSSDGRATTTMKKATPQ